MNAKQFYPMLSLGVLAIGLLSLIGCSTDEIGQVSTANTLKSEAGNRNQYQVGVVHALNLGGPTYRGQDNITYQADSLALDAEKHRSTGIKGSQDPTLYESYREGDMSLVFELENGHYDVTLKFAEPTDIALGERLIRVHAQGRLAIGQLDIRLARDGQPRSALDRTVTNIEVTEGQLILSLTGLKGQPVLHALIIRKQPASESAWQLVWQDEFEYNGAPDPTKWTHDVWPAGKVNDEDQAYTDRAKNARVEDGKLIIEAHKEAYHGANYTSARLHTLNKADFLYGKAEVRARIPKGQGTWSAIWMLPSDPFTYATSCQQGDDWQGSSTCDAWPNSGEIDIMEYVGYDPTTVHGTVHTKAFYWVNWQQRKGSIQVGDEVNDEFQTYSMHWGPDYISLAMNDTPYFYYSNPDHDWQAWPFDHPYHLILNLAIGGAWGRAGGPIDDSIFPVQMEIDYVRIYQATDGD